MEVEDKVVSLFLRSIIAPKIFDMSHPGFVVSRFGEKNRVVYRRELFYPEELLAEIETRFIRRYGARADRALYRIGKKFGYEYAKLSCFPTCASESEANLKNFAHFLILFVSATWARNSEEVVVDVRNKEFRAKFEDYIVCSKNGICHLLGDGGIAGIWAYLVQDQTVEGVQVACEKRGAKYCEFYVAPKKCLTGEGLAFFEAEIEDDLSEEEGRHGEINRIRTTQSARNSTQNLIDAGIFRCQGRRIMFRGCRYFSVDIDLLYLLERELLEFKGGKELLFKTCFEFGVKNAAGAPRTTEFVTDYLSAIGFGDVLVSFDGRKYSVIANYFPWMARVKGSDFTVFRGLASGLLSRIYGKQIKFPRAKMNLTGADFSVVLKEI